MLAALAQAEQRARRAGGRGQKTKKLKGLRRPAKAGASNKGCGTGAGGFAAGNKCALEDGVPKTPVGNGGPLTKPSVSKARQKAEALRRKATQKQKEKEAKAKAGKDKFAYEKKRASRKAAEKAERTRREELKQRLDRDKKRKEMLQSIRIRRGNERLTIADQGESLDTAIQRAKDEQIAQTRANIEKSPIRGILEEVRDKYVESARRVHGAGCEEGLCAPIAEGVATEFPRGKYRDDVEITEYFGKGGPGSRDHASILVVDHANRVAYEVDIPEGKYQTRTPSGFVTKEGVLFDSDDVVVTKLKYADHRRTANYSGKGDNVTKNAGETTADFVARKHKRDLDELHKDIEGRLKDVEAALGGRKVAIKSLEEKRDLSSAAVREAYSRLGSAKGKADIDEATKQLSQKREEAKAAWREHDEAITALEDARNAAQREAIHDALSGFSAAHRGPGDHSYAESLIRSFTPPLTLNPGVSKQNTEIYIEALPDVMKFYSRTASPKFIKAITSQRVITTRSLGGGSHINDRIEIGVQDATTNSEVRNKIPGTIAHEFGHAIESSHPEIMRANAEDYRKRYSRYIAQAQKDGIEVYTVKYPTAKGYFGPSTNRNKPKPDSVLGYVRNYTDFNLGNDHMKYPPGDRYSSGTEVFSTGVEYMYKDPARLYRGHRNQFNLVALALSGRLE